MLIRNKNSKSLILCFFDQKAPVLSRQKFSHSISKKYRCHQLQNADLTLGCGNVRCRRMATLRNFMLTTRHELHRSGFSANALYTSNRETPRSSNDELFWANDVLFNLCSAKLNSSRLTASGSGEQRSVYALH